MKLAVTLLLFSSSALAQSMPRPDLTPGATRNLDKTTICNTKWGLDRRFVTKEMKQQVCKAYNLTEDYCFGHHPNPKTGKPEPNVEFDHWIPRELAGADDPLNLWPQPWDEARKKDRTENAGHKDYCSGKLTLEQAWDEVRNWAGQYKWAVFGEPETWYLADPALKNCSDHGEVWWPIRADGQCYLADKPRKYVGELPGK